MIDKPVARRVFARSISLEQSCRSEHVDFTAFQSALNGAIRKGCSGHDLIQIAPRQA
jgi:hypothetical protein